MIALAGKVYLLQNLSFHELCQHYHVQINRKFCQLLNDELYKLFVSYPSKRRKWLVEKAGLIFFLFSYFSWCFFFFFGARDKLISIQTTSVPGYVLSSVLCVSFESFRLHQLIKREVKRRPAFFVLSAVLTFNFLDSEQFSWNNIVF